MFWVLAISYIVHLIATVIWFGSLMLLAIIAWPALLGQPESGPDWLAIQKRLAPWANLSLVVLLISGFVQMTNDPNYTGFLVIDSTWAWAMLVKHVAFALLGGVTAYLQFNLYPAYDRLQLLLQQRPKLAATEQEALQRQEKRMLRVNLACALVIFVCTGVATAV
jgi:uncharacterized membrane protein